MLELTGHRSNSINDHKVFVSYEINSDYMEVEFEVMTSELKTSEQFNQQNWDNWGLWEFDVVEVFIQKSHVKNHYLELEATPLNQKLALMIEKPREVFHKVELERTTVLSSKTDDGFSTKFKIYFDEIPGDSNELRGNFHACLSHREKRLYFSLNSNPEEQADFHRPELFQDLGEIVK